MNVSDLNGKVVMVTGAGSGVGRNVAGLLAEVGAKLALCDVQEERLQETLRLVAKHKPEAAALRTDLLRDEDVQRFFALTEERFGRLDVLINCAGIWDEADIERIDEARFERMIGINLKGTFFTCRGAFSLMRKQGGPGAIVNVASAAGEYGSIRSASHYAASKGGVIALSKSLAREGAKDRIRVNVVSPGPLDTPMSNYENDGRRDLVAGQTLLGRVGAPEDISHAILFLASSVSSWITGEVLRVNGGILI